MLGCQAADAATTLEGVSRGAEERNPVVGGIFERFGAAGFLAAKAGVTLLVLHNYAELSRDLVATLDGVTCAAAAHNGYVISRLPPAPAPR
ncbi:MAG TPA: DUF5658 family protein [Burkholderiales bacterium]